MRVCSSSDFISFSVFLVPPREATFTVLAVLDATFTVAALFLGAGAGFLLGLGAGFLAGDLALPVPPAFFLSSDFPPSPPSAWLPTPRAATAPTATSTAVLAPSAAAPADAAAFGAAGAGFGFGLGASAFGAGASAFGFGAGASATKGAGAGLESAGFTALFFPLLELKSATLTPPVWLMYFLYTSTSSAFAACASSGAMTATRAAATAAWPALCNRLVVTIWALCSAFLSCWALHLKLFCLWGNVPTRE